MLLHIIAKPPVAPLGNWATEGLSAATDVERCHPDAASSYQNNFTYKDNFILISKQLPS